MTLFPYSVASLDPTSPKYDAKRYWRGPVWVVINTLIGMGLKEAGYKAQAERIRSDSARLIEKGGFAEYFDPEDGSPAGGGSFSWTGRLLARLGFKRIGGELRWGP
ncbi:hypothetical protein [uncultured Cohaesibacter sp.]|uniref:MGH1-like glycoside hydrolase domain-containing protein n=1 Tax=uncultured Cohaesibacter sp. TaxID=1002546 RepID=UPI00292D3653|nr:hypothetical protein [uncultured Cohaesibacter sp.]